MAQPNITLRSFAGTENENFREFERLLRSIIGVAAIANNQRANFLQLHIKDAALRYFQTLPEVTRADFELSLTSLRNHFNNPQLVELHIIKLESIRFDPKIDTPENFLVTLQNMAQKAYPDPTPEVIPPADPALDADNERNCIEAAEARNEEALRFAQQERNHQIKRFFKKCMPSWLRAKLLEQPDTATVDDLCLLARRQLTIHNLCKIDDFGENAFNEVSVTVSDNLVNALTKIYQSQENMESRINELSKKVDSQLSPQNADLNSGNSYRGRGGRYIYRGFRGGQGFRGFRGRGRGNYQNYNPFSAQNYALTQYTPVAQDPTNATPDQAQSTDLANNTTVQVFQPQNHIPVTQYAQITCHFCGYPNHLASQCTLNKNRRRGGGKFPFNRAGKN